MHRRWQLLIIGLSLLPATAGVADDRRPLRDAHSENQRYHLRVYAGRPGGGRNQRPRATLLEYLGDRGRRRTVWRAPLENEVSPAYALIRNDGQFLVTLDEFRCGGAAHALVVYDHSGKVLREFGLRELLRGDDWKNVSVERRAVQWLDGARFTFDDDPPQFVVDLRWKRRISIDLVKLEISSGESHGPGADEDPSAVVPPEILALLNEANAASDIADCSQLGDTEDPAAVAEVLCDLAAMVGLAPEPFALIASPDEQARRVGEAPLIDVGAEPENTPSVDAESTAQAAFDEDPGEPAADAAPQPQYAGTSAEAGWGIPMPDPEHPVDYVACVMERTVTDGPSAVPLYEAAFEQCHEFAGDWDVVEAAMRGDAAALASPEIAAFLEMHQDALANFNAAIQFEYRGMPKPGDYQLVVDILLPSLSKMRHLAKISVLQAKSLEADGQIEAALTQYTNTLAVGAQVSDGTTLIEHLVGNAVQSLAADRLLDSLGASADADIDYRWLAEQLEGKYRPLHPMAEILQGERACGLDMIQYMYKWVPETGECAVSDENLQRVAATFGGFDPGSEAALKNSAEMRAALETIGFEQMVAEANEQYDTMTHAASLPYPEAKKAWNDFERSIESAEYRQHNPLLASFLPALSRADFLSTRARATRNATRLIANLQAYRQQHGTYPESLDVFGDADMTTDVFTGGRFVYRPDGDSFTLYSLGGNGVDDGGVHDPRADTNDVVHWPRPGH